METLLLYVFGAGAFVPHGYCLLWRPDLVAMHAISDGLIALAYFSIPAAIYTFVRRRPDFRHHRVAGLDAFKRVNDTHGHPAGGAMLIETARRPRGCFRRHEGHELRPRAIVGIALDRPTIDDPISLFADADRAV